MICPPDGGSEQGPDQLVPEQSHGPDRTRARNGNKRDIPRNKAVGGILKEHLDGGLEALSQNAEQLAVVLES